MRLQLSAALALFISGAVPTATAALDPSREATQYRQASWSLEDGLPYGNVNCLLQSADGYLWIGTTAGLSRFDGIEFSDPPSPLADALAGRSIAALAEGPDGTLWAGTDEGIVSYRGGVTHSYGPQQGLSHPKVTALALDGRGRLWAGTLSGLDRLDGARFTAFSTHDGLPNDYIFSLALEPDSGLLWVGTYSGLAVLRDDGFQTVDLGADAERSIGAILPLNGGLWLGTTEGGLLRRRADGALERWSAPEGIQALLADRDGQLWLGTLRGLWRFRQGEFEAPLAVTDVVLALVEDGEGDIWAGTRPGGLYRLSDASFVAWSSHEGLPDGATTAVLEDRRGDIWIGTRNGLGQLHDGRVAATLTTRDGLVDNEVLSLAESDQGILWVATRKGLHRLHEGALERVEPDALPIRGPYWALLAGSGDDLWLGAFGGVAHMGSETRVLSSSSHPRDSGSAFTRAPLGGVRIGTLGSGVWDPDAGQPVIADTARGLPSDIVHSLLMTSDGSLWVGTANGLARVKAGRVFAFGEPHGMPEDEICALLEADDGALWICTPRGILRADRASLDAVAAAGAGRVRGRLFNSLDGMPSSECHSNGAWKTRDGKLWFPTPRGAAVVDPARLVTNDVPPKVVLESVVVDGQPLVPGSVTVLPPGSRRLEFHFAALSFRAPERVTYRFKLDGLDEDWMEGGTQRAAYYMNLRPGAYRFQVMAANEDSVWSATPATLSFQLQPPLWATAWFRGAALGVLLVAGYQLYRWRERSVKREFAAVLADRSRMAREIHDTLAQGLAGIAIQLEAAEDTLVSGPELARQHLARALTLARSSLAEARRSVLGLRPRALDGSNLVAALERSVADLAWGSDLTVKLETSTEPRPLPRSVEDNILRVAQEAVSNAVLHSGARVVRVELRYERYAVTLRVLDDGVGFSPEEVFVSPGDRLGLIGMRERAEEIEGRLSVHSEPGMGTEVLLTVPIP